MSYVALYRKYRSQTFDELIGQDQVTRTLRNAIRSDRLAHAYLFHGARGCGKTSTARLLARALNCLAHPGPTPDPCGVCTACVSIRSGSCLDVLEMDAASETGIDDVREKIVENVQYAPGEVRCKVYIIDEVHDLSAKAFDALLKTLEEPPPHVVFILATTELHKVPITIRSRCQPFHFKRGSIRDLAASVQRVVEAEGYSAEPEAIQAIARSAEGSWRDALSILEQVLAYADGCVTAEAVRQAIGAVAADSLLRITDVVARGDWAGVLAVAAELIDSGKDVRQLFAALSAHIRDLMLIAAGAERAAEEELGPDRLTLLRPQAALFTPSALLEMMAALSAGERELRFTNQHRWLLERTLLTMAEAARAERHAALPRAQADTGDRASLPRARSEDADRLAPRRDARPAAPATRHSDARPRVEPSAPAAVSDAGPVERDAASGEARPATADAGRFAGEVTLEVVQRAWPRVLKSLERASPMAANLLAQTAVQALDGHTVVVAFTDQFKRDRIQNKGRDLIEKKLNQTLSTDGYRIRCELADSSTHDQRDAVPTSPEALFGDRAAVVVDDGLSDERNPPAAHAVRNPASSREEPGLLEAALEIFGGEIVETTDVSAGGA